MTSEDLAAQGYVKVRMSDDDGYTETAWALRIRPGEDVFRLDTGANGSVTFHEPAVRKLGLLEGREVHDAKVGGVGGFVDARQGELAWFEIGGVRTDRVPAMFAVEPKGSFADEGRAGNIGIDLLRSFVMYFDYENGRIAFVARDGG